MSKKDYKPAGKITKAQRLKEERRLRKKDKKKKQK